MSDEPVGKMSRRTLVEEIIAPDGPLDDYLRSRGVDTSTAQVYLIDSSATRLDLLVYAKTREGYPWRGASWPNVAFCHSGIPVEVQSGYVGDEVDDIGYYEWTLEVPGGGVLVRPGRPEIDREGLQPESEPEPSLSRAQSPIQSETVRDLPVREVPGLAPVASSGPTPESGEPGDSPGATVDQRVEIPPLERRVRQPVDVPARPTRVVTAVDFDRSVQRLSARVEALIETDGMGDVTDVASYYGRAAVAEVTHRQLVMFGQDWRHEPGVKPSTCRACEAVALAQKEERKLQGARSPAMSATQWRKFDEWVRANGLESTGLIEVIFQIDGVRYPADLGHTTQDKCSIRLPDPVESGKQYRLAILTFLLLLPELAPDWSHLMIPYQPHPRPQDEFVVPVLIEGWDPTPDAPSCQLLSLRLLFRRGETLH